MNDVTNLRDTIIPKSDQLNSESLLGTELTITVTSVRRSTDEQPVEIHYDGEQGRPYKPCKTMRKALIYCWGDDGREWVGRSMRLYCDPDVKFGGVKVGGIRISHLSHIEMDQALSLTATRGKKETVVIRRLEGGGRSWLDAHMDTIANATTMAELQKAFVTAQAENKRLGDAATLAKIASLKDLRKAEIAEAAA
jgi:hypothetical protein